MSDTDCADPVAEPVWRRVASASDRIANLLCAIPVMTLRGAATRSELMQSQGLLEQAAALLASTAAREGSRYSEEAAAFARAAETDRRRRLPRLVVDNTRAVQP